NTHNVHHTHGSPEARPPRLVLLGLCYLRELEVDHLHQLVRELDDTLTPLAPLLVHDELVLLGRGVLLGGVLLVGVGGRGDRGALVGGVEDHGDHMVEEHVGDGVDLLGDAPDLGVHQGERVLAVDGVLDRVVNGIDLAVQEAEELGASLAIVDHVQEVADVCDALEDGLGLVDRSLLVRLLRQLGLLLRRLGLLLHRLELAVVGARVADPALLLHNRRRGGEAGLHVPPLGVVVVLVLALGLALGLGALQPRRSARGRSLERVLGLDSLGGRVERGVGGHRRSGLRMNLLQGVLDLAVHLGIRRGELPPHHPRQHLRGRRRRVLDDERGRGVGHSGRVSGRRVLGRRVLGRRVLGRRVLGRRVLITPRLLLKSAEARENKSVAGHVRL
ncbi:hypothetical protein T484DRAFT_3632804, partial [Baffinella frigidus]